jgi:hypothetical protein
MINSEVIFPSDEGHGGGDSLNTDLVVVTKMKLDYTVRPMRESLRKRLKRPPATEPPPTRDGKNQSA